MKILVVVLILCISIINATDSPCGIFGTQFENEKCLCGAYTQPNYNGQSCTNGTGICTPPFEGSIGQNELYTLKLKATSLNFVGQNLIITLEFPSIPTANTDISVFTKNGTFLSSLGDGISGRTLGNWTQGIDSTGLVCAQNVTWVVNWQELAPLVQLREKGHFAFDIAATSHIIREKTKLSIRTTDVAPSILVDVVPIFINLDQIVSTKHSKDRVELVLDYDVRLNYFLKKLHLDPSNLKVRAVIEHSISFPLSLRSENLVVSINGEAIPSRSYEIETKEDCPATKGSLCLSKTLVLFSLPFQNNCSEYQLNIDVDLASKCHGVNDHTSKFLCYGLQKSLSQQSVHVNLPIKYNFCPKIETTEVSVKSFVLKQGDDVLINNEILNRDVPLTGEIVLNIDRIFRGSVFTSATISSIKFVESSANPASYEVVDVSTLTNGVLASSNTIDISFSYIPSYQLITTYLQNWANGFFVQVTIDVSFYSPEGLKKRNSGDSIVSPDSNNDDPLIHTTVRLQIPNRALPKYLKRDHILASSSNLKLNEIFVKKSLEEHHLAKQKIQTEKISDQLKTIQKDNEVMIYLILGSVCACFLVLLVAGILIYKLTRRSSTEQTIEINTK